VNGALLIWAFIFRSQIGVGYITGFAAILAAGLLLAIVTVGSCAISFPFWFLGWQLGLLVFGGVGIFGFGWFVKLVVETTTAWWSAYESTPQDQDR
jgi:hypothetical protein